MTRVEVRHVGQRFGDTQALSDVSVVLEGEGIYGLLGRNGSGKTTLLSILAGFRRPSTGAVLLDGSPIWEDPRLTREVCLIREGGDTVDGSETIEAALTFARMLRPHWDHEYALELIERFQLSAKKKVGALSRGQRAALACTLGLASRAPVTLFDESYLGLDAPARYAFYDELLRDYMEHPRVIVISTHLIEEVESMFGEVVILDHGRVLSHDEADALRARGAAVTGSVAAIERFVAGRTVLSDRQLGPTRSVVVYGDRDPISRVDAEQAGLEVGPLPLQDLFVHLTTAERSPVERADR